MKKENLSLIAEGHKLIALAYAREAGVELDLTPGTEISTKEEATSKPTSSKTQTAKTETKPEPEVETSTDAEEGYTAEDLNGMTIKQLKEIASENEINIPKDTKKAEIIEILLNGGVEEDAEAEAEEGEDADAEEGFEEMTIDDVESMPLAELKNLAKEYEVDLPKTVKKPEAVDLLVKALFDAEDIEAYYNTEEDAEDAEAEAEGDEISPEDLEEMSLTELKALADEYEVKYPKIIKADKLRAILVEALFEEDEDDSTDLDNEDLAKEYGLDEMTVEELTELLLEHEIKAKGNKEALIAKVLEAIEEGVIEVGDEDAGE